MIVALDLETTWLNNKEDHIIEVALIKFDENTFEIIEEYSTLINPKIHIPELNSNITNIFDEDVKDSPYIEDVKNKIEDFIWDNPILWHNTYFDRDFLIKNWVDIEDNVVLDTFFLSNFLVIDQPSLSLESLSKYFNIKLEWAHRAYDDTLATLKLFEKLLLEVQKLSSQKKQVLSYIFSKSNDSTLIYLKDLLLLNSFDISDDEVSKILLKSIKSYKPLKDISINEDIDVSFSEDIFKNFKNFELRDNQIKMSELISDSLIKDKKIVIEAPTWVWKTFAYLIPSIIYSVKNWEKVVISTNTKILQDQIVYKDLDFLSKNLDIDFSFCKLKWKRNYIWINPFFEMLISSLRLEKSEASFVAKICLWLFKTKTWELDELNFYWEEYWYIKLINADKFYILRDDNIYKRYEYIHKARQSSQKSNIVVINHSLLLQDIDGDNAILWKIDNLVIDEVHNLEDTTTESVKYWYSYKNIEDIFTSIWRIINKNNFIFPEFEKNKNDILLDLSYIYDSFYSYINIKVNSDINYKNTLISEDFYFDNSDVVAKNNNLELKFLNFINILQTSEDNCYKDLADDISSLEKCITLLKVILDMESHAKNINIATYNEHSWVILSTTLLRPWDFLKAKLWNKVDSLVLTSATLRVWNNFDYIKNILWLSDDFNFEILNTDFDYEKQVLLFIPTDLWSIKNNSATLNNFLKELFIKVKWRALTLFTSFYTIKEAYLSMNLELRKNNINLYAQWLAWWKHKLMTFFKENSKNSILFWTDTFREWVDIPWEDLEYLIIYKLPFMVPTDPVFKARSAIFKNSFSDYSIPKSILKLRQGFWRLIRTKDDKWIVIFLDDRIHSTSWWKEFYKSFPENIKIKKWNSVDFLDIIWKRK